MKNAYLIWRTFLGIKIHFLFFLCSKKNQNKDRKEKTEFFKSDAKLDLFEWL